MPRVRKGDPAPPTIECPRCGYDVTGTMSLWTESCPLEGRCSECGYGFQWKHLLGPNLGVPKWFFETARRRKIRAAISTSVRTVVPWKFWKDVPLHARFSVTRMFLIVATVTAGMYATSILAFAANDVIETVAGALHPNPGFTSMQVARWALRDMVHTLGWFARWPVDPDATVAPRFGSLLLWLAIAIVLTPMCFFAISGTLRTHRVRWLHIVRGSVYAGVATALVLAMWFLAAGIQWIWDQRFSGNQYSYWQHRNIGTEWLWFWWPAVFVGWWWIVCRVYLRIQHPFWVALLMNMMALLAAAIILYPITMDPLTWYDLGQW